MTSTVFSRNNISDRKNASRKLYTCDFCVFISFGFLHSTWKENQGAILNYRNHIKTIKTLERILKMNNVFLKLKIK
jgi:hypothetical protein